MNKNITKIRVVIADDHPLTLAGIRTILESQPDMEIVGEAVDGEETKTLVSETKPDILLLDLVMPETKPTEVNFWVRKYFPETEVLILTGHVCDTFLASTMESGAVGFLDKGEAPDRLVEAIRRAYLGQMIFSEDQVIRSTRWQVLVGDRWNVLSIREREVLECMVQGMDNQMIADALNLSVNTVRFHNHQIFEKLGVTNRCEAVAFVLNNKLLDL